MSDDLNRHEPDPGMPELKVERITPEGTIIYDVVSVVRRGIYAGAIRRRVRLDEEINELRQTVSVEAAEHDVQRKRAWAAEAERDALKFRMEAVDSVISERNKLSSDNGFLRARVDVLEAALSNLHSATLAWAEQPRTAQDTVNWMTAMRRADRTLGVETER